ncbi:hypothetical protein BHU72_14635 [Desulfuribacillus stibiiarsenatis]|uniref:Uncharacterized protein n=1 Tax=Desulfuribacillus stibiiarsenatis TaxID=1390249 RepID=A0A1E5L7Z6_9FIRM|nr:hypothetical protein [Desulfuribacillus stibiiarsenatis]OEH86063.1 hypothetical protein BHU72_14635 [Desulfuribacillus stibiiarsenatis]
MIEQEKVVESITAEIAQIQQELVKCFQEYILGEELTLEEIKVLAEQISNDIRFNVITPKLCKHKLRIVETEVSL